MSTVMQMVGILRQLIEIAGNRIAAGIYLHACSQPQVIEMPISITCGLGWGISLISIHLHEHRSLTVTYPLLIPSCLHY